MIQQMLVPLLRQLLLELVSLTRVSFFLFAGEEQPGSEDLFYGWLLECFGRALQMLLVCSLDFLGSAPAGMVRGNF